MIIDGIRIDILLPEQTDSPLPLVLINDDMNSEKQIYELCDRQPFILASLSGFDWNRDLSPWPCKAVFRNGEDFAGGADAYLDRILSDILPAIRKQLDEKNIGVTYTALAGYSLAGLFALYAATRCDAFQRIASASGSLWYPGFRQYLTEKGISSQIDRVYLSLGDLEAKTKNQIMCTVQEETEKICGFLSDKTKAVFELNEGNHFKDAPLRTAKGILYLLKDQ